MAELLGGAFYINLDRRPDRNQEIEEELDNLGLHATRFSAIDRSPGIVGCGYSHLAVLKMARERNYKNVLIFEDDFQPLVTKSEFWKQIKEFFRSNLPYDVLMLAYKLEEYSDFNDHLYKVNYATTASAYIVNSTCYNKLIELYEINLPKLIETGQHWIYANDQIWVSLQKEGGWYALKTRLGKQRASFSDNSLIFVKNDY